MEKIKNALIPAKFVYDPYAHNEEHIFADNERVFQGIPGIEVTSNGTVYYTFYTGTDGEHPGNFVLVYRTTIDKLGSLEQKPYLAVVPTTPDVRCFDEVLWIDPQGRLWLFWAQSWGNEKTHIDGRFGTWAAVCDDPDEDEPKFSEPRRIANGIMMNKPCVTKDGDWLLPCAIWAGFDSYYSADLADEKFSNVYRSRDNGETFELIGRSDWDKRSIDEHMITELKDGTLLMLIRGRGIGRSVSRDGGVTWEETGDSGIPGPGSRFHIRRLPSGAHLLLSNVSEKERNNLAAQLSYDDCKTWTKPFIFDERMNVSYPDAAVHNGRIYIIYDRERYADEEVLMACITEADILYGDFVTPGSKTKVLINKGWGRK